MTLSEKVITFFLRRLKAVASESTIGLIIKQVSDIRKDKYTFIIRCKTLKNLECGFLRHQPGLKSQSYNS